MTDDPLALPVPPRTDRRQVLAVGLFLLVIVGVMLGPLWSDITSRAIGDPKTDVIRGLWGLDHLRRSLLPPDTPLWSNRLGFPAGALTLVLPWFSGICLAPLGLLLGPVVAWNLGIVLLLWALGMATAWLVRTATDSWSAGAVAGAAMLGQPMLHAALFDGTAEHLALWTLPACLAAVLRALQTLSVRWALAAGLLSICLPLDSAYLAIYAAVASVVLPFALLRRWPRADLPKLARCLAVMIAVAAVGAVAVISLYQSFPLDTAAGKTAGEGALYRNATDLRVWWQTEFRPSALRDTTLTPCVIPLGTLWPALALAVVGLPRSLPWTAVGLFMVSLSLGLNSNNAQALQVWMGADGAKLGATILATNTALAELPGIGSVRFPARWLAPGALMLIVGGSFGLARILRLLRVLGPILAVPLAIASVVEGVTKSRLHHPFPVTDLPEIAFARWMEDQGSGAAILLPIERPAPASGFRADIPVFASLSDDLAATDILYLQVLHEGAQADAPGLQTIRTRPQRPEVSRLIRDWNDLAQVPGSNRGFAHSAYDKRVDAVRKTGISIMLDEGLKWVVLDLGTYQDNGIAEIERHLEGHVVQTKRFDEGDGVLVMEVGEAD